MASLSPFPSPFLPHSHPRPVPPVPCNRQLARYTCPTCNAPYCALACFRSPAHAACSEAFYKKEVEADIRSAPGKSGKERARMMGLLRRFEEESAAREGGVPPEEPDEGEEEDEDEDGDALARRLQRVDLDSTSPSALWALLPPSLRARFLKTMADPQSALAQELLLSEALALAVTPWWVSSAPGTRLPQPIAVPAALKGAPGGAGKGLVYNIASVLIAYAYTTRHLARSPLASAPSAPASSHSGADSGGVADADAHVTPDTTPDPDPNADPDPDPDTPAARTLMAQLVPFLTERASTTRHPTLDSALTALRSRLPDDVPLAPLLRDAAVLLRPAPVLIISPSSSSPSSSNASPNTNTADPADAPDALHADTLETAEPDQTAHPSARALGDLRALFLASPSHPPSSPHSNPPSNSHPRPKHTHVAHKLAFYAASLQAPGGEGEARARAVAAEMEGAAGVEEREAEARKGEREAEVDGPMGKVGVKVERRVGIEELEEGKGRV
ncbi:hypothetical protein FB451DRAFT_1444178 [Mycena latifolia]|nr:hypothetical protein FB451DRAFT_1444178 [Mycena latifolia]